MPVVKLFSMAHKSTLHSFSGVDVVILAGGLGTRLRPAVSDRPKVMAEVGGRPFLDILIGNLRKAGFRRIILSVGHLKDQIKRYFIGKRILFVEEEQPLGTGGGLKNAEPLIASEHFFVMNGDSWIAGDIDFQALHDFHKAKNALATAILVRPREEKDYGAVFLGDDQKVQRFNERARENKEHFMNAGIYCMKKDALAYLPSGTSSLETDFFPRLVGGEFYGFPVEGELVDIGTPERYKLANRIFDS